MQQVERDLQTKLDRVAVDHRDTDNPHSHVLLQGKTAGGQDLGIDPEYISRGMRPRAQEIATEWLGPRTDREIQASRHQELVVDRLTPLDQTLQRDAVDGQIDLRQMPATPSARHVHAQKLGRLAHLAKLGPGTGVYLRSVQLVSGRYALLGDGMNFSLVPWRQELERGCRGGLRRMGRGEAEGAG